MSGMGKKRAVICLGVCAAVVVGAYFFMKMRGPDDPIARYDAVMAKDDVGGATPRATLDMFVAALRANDAEKAASYFMLDDNLSRATWADRLNQLKEKGLLGRMADDIEKNAQATKPAYEGDAEFEILNNDGSVGALIDMERNKFSGVWKLQGF